MMNVQKRKISLHLWSLSQMDHLLQCNYSFQHTLAIPVAHQNNPFYSNQDCTRSKSMDVACSRDIFTCLKSSVFCNVILRNNYKSIKSRSTFQLETSPILWSCRWISILMKTPPKFYIAPHRPMVKKRIVCDEPQNL